MAYGRPTAGTSSRPVAARPTGPTSYGRPTSAAAAKKKKSGPGGILGAIEHFTGHPGDILTPIHFAASPIGWILGHHASNPKLRAAGNVATALSSSPADVVMHPNASAHNLAGMVVGLAETPTAMKKSIEKFGVSKTLSILYHTTVADYKTRYGKDWETHARSSPLFNLADAFMILSPALKAAAVAGAMGDLGRLGEAATLEARAARGTLIKGGRSTAWKDMSAAERLRIARAEARRPGVMTKGKASTRDLSLQIGPGDALYPEGKIISSSQPLAHGVLRRGLQTSLDELAQHFPDMPMAGARSRIIRANAGQLPRTMDRFLGTIVGLDALRGLNQAEKTRLWAEAQLVKHVVDPATGEVIHDHAAVSQKIKDLRNALASEFEDKSPHNMDKPDLQAWLLGAKQQSFGTALLKRLDDAAAYVPKKGGKYERAIAPLMQATHVAEQTIKDTDGFTTLENDIKRMNDRIGMMEDEHGNIIPGHEEDHAAVAQQLDETRALLASKGPQLAEMLHKRRSLLSDWVNVNTPVNAPERAAWAKAMTDLGWTPEQVRVNLQASDMMARSARPENPASFYAEKIGTPAGMTPQQVAIRAHALWQDFPEHGMTRMVEGDVMAPAETTAYYSTAQKEIAKGWGKKGTRQAGQVRKTLKDSMSADQWQNSGLENFFNQHDPNMPITQPMLHEFLANRLNQYNLRETHLVNTEYARDLGYGPRWGAGSFSHEYGAWDDELLSRTPENGEYHEIFFDLPEGTINPTSFERKGLQHWGKPNVTMHVRFQVFTENGIKKLLIEEIQSDWARAWTKQNKAEVAYGPMDPAWETKRNHLQVAVNEARRAYENANRSHRMLAEQRDQLRFQAETFTDPEQAAWAKSGLKDMVKSVMEAESEKERATLEYNRADLALDNHMATRPGDVPPPPQSLKNAQRFGVSRILRHAADNGVDEVIVVDGPTQNARNMTMGFSRGVDDEERFWETLLTKEEADPFDGVTRTYSKNTREAYDAVDADVGPTHFTRIYEKEIPAAIEKRIGVKGEMIGDAYQGHMGTQHGMRTETGPMAGTVYKMTDAARAAAREADVLFQRQPEWNNVPRGANELLIGKGNRLIHMFKNADVSTWIHELSHSAIYDLSEADKALLNTHYGEGAKAITSWADTAHENYARDFERFVRTGDLSFLPRPVAEVFKRIQLWMQRTYREAKNAQPQAEIPQEVQEVFGRMLYRDMGDTPDIFIPHRPGAPELTGARTTRGIPRAGRELGDYTQSRVPIFARNNLGLLRSGLIHDDPNLLIEHVNRLVSLQKANQLREFLLHNASPLLPGRNPDFETQYVIKRAGSSIDKPLYDALESAHNPSEIRGEIARYIDSNLSNDPAVVRGWEGEGQLYTIDKKTVDMMFKYVTGKVPGAATKPASVGGQVIDAVLNSMRGLLLYANPGFYVANFVGNLGMQMFNDPRSLRYLGPSLKQAMAMAHHGKVDPLFERINIEMGRGPSSGSLSPERTGILGPELGTPSGPVVGRGAAAVTRGMHAIGHTAGALVDDAFRVSTWRQEAAKLGYKTDAQVTKLLDTAVKDSREAGYMKGGTKALDDLNQIRDKAEQLMLDFNSMTPLEKTWLSRIIFLYPFLKASAKYPAMYAGEHPFAFGAAAQGSNVGQQFANEILGPRPNLPLWARGYARVPGGMANVGAIDQMSVLAGMLESMTHLGHKTPVGINSPWEYAPPIVQLLNEALRGQNRYGRESGVGGILRSDFAVPAWISALYREPSQLYTDRGELAAILRSLRLAPFGVNPDYGTTGPVGAKGWGSAKGWGK